jgi:hypothetical protein
MAAITRLLAWALCAVALAACAQLRAEAPLFSPADQTGPAPLREGIWIAIGEGCADRNTRRRSRFPRECEPMQISRMADGTWLAAPRIDLIANLNRAEREQANIETAEPLRAIIAPAVERPLGGEYAPVYVAELRALRSETPATNFAVLAPLGPMPAEAFYVIAPLGCAAILREGPIPGIAPEYMTRVDESGEHQDLSGCVASSQAAVREAARRAVIENIGSLMEQRYVFVRAN